MTATAVKVGVYCGIGAHDKCRPAASRCECDCHKEKTMPPARPLREAPPVPSDHDDDELIWEEPPNRGTRSVISEISLLLPRLRRNPGKWARLRDFKAKSGGSTAAKKCRDHEPYADIEFRGSIRPSGSALYGRYTGE